VSVFDWQHDVLPVTRVTYALMEERGEDLLDWEDLGPRLTHERTEGELYNIFQQIKRGGYADVQFAGGMTIALVQPTERGCSSHTGGQFRAKAKSRLSCGSLTR